MQTLKFCPKPSYQVESEPRRKVIQFGDGYQQRQVDGLNPLLRKFELTYKLHRQSAVEFDRFLTNHGGVHAFWFREYEGGTPIKAVCPSWSKTVGQRYTEFHCTFEEVI